MHWRDRIFFGFLFKLRGVSTKANSNNTGMTVMYPTTGPGHVVWWGLQIPSVQFSAVPEQDPGLGGADAAAGGGVREEGGPQDHAARTVSATVMTSATYINRNPGSAPLPTWEKKSRLMGIWISFAGCWGRRDERRTTRRSDSIRWTRTISSSSGTEWTASCCTSLLWLVKVRACFTKLRNRVFLHETKSTSQQETTLCRQISVHCASLCELGLDTHARGRRGLFAPWRISVSSGSLDQESFRRV